MKLENILGTMNLPKDIVALTGDEQKDRVKYDDFIMDVIGVGKASIDKYDTIYFEANGYAVANSTDRELVDYAIALDKNVKFLMSDSEVRDLINSMEYDVNHDIMKTQKHVSNLFTNITDYTNINDISIGVDTNGTFYKELKKYDSKAMLNNLEAIVASGDKWTYDDENALYIINTLKLNKLKTK